MHSRLTMLHQLNLKQSIPVIWRVKRAVECIAVQMVRIQMLRAHIVPSQIGDPDHKSKMPNAIVVQYRGELEHPHLELPDPHRRRELIGGNLRAEGEYHLYRR